MADRLRSPSIHRQSVYRKDVVCGRNRFQMGSASNKKWPGTLQGLPVDVVVFFHDDKKKEITVLCTLSGSRMLEMQGDGELEPVLTAVTDACKQINRIVQRAKTDDLYGVVDSTNIQGEVQQKLDVLVNSIMLRAFCGCTKDVIATVASEEEDEPRSCRDVMGDEAFGGGNYVAVFDPIDGSKNIDAALPVGSIFG
eukprot:CAMPEP_0116825616 /NCGR_PEP_ID=MMETSP0418-20121206/2066_1 /TAXON_ID=1158023 /ORGANISM="Astrosyne radiata, Strain 13vi08-1A" /LENGTH=195 /DNA_ID=CAMNT_0004454147 /DNA_START=20 /DNA_END=605 /DNA_ORIENTATION=-